MRLCLYCLDVNFQLTSKVYRLSSIKIKTLTYSEYRVWGPKSLVAAFPSVVEQVVQDHDILVAAVGSLHCVVSKCRGTGSSGSQHFVIVLIQLVNSSQ